MKKEELENNWKRTAADFENFRKRVESEKANWSTATKAELILKLAPILDNFRRAAAHAPEDNQWTQGILAIEKQLEKILEDEGVVKIAPAENTPFNPNLHEAISHEKNEKIAADHIIAVTESGWQMGPPRHAAGVTGEKVLKPAKVRISAGSML